MIRAIDQIIEENNKRKLSELWRRCDLTWEEKFLMAGWFDAPKISKDELAKEIESHPSILDDFKLLAPELLEPEGEHAQVLVIMADEIH